MNDNPYDSSLEWTGFHNQQTENIHRYESAQLYPLTPAYQREKVRPNPAGSPPRRLSKSEALERANYLKGFIMAATLLGFGVLGGLVASQLFTNTPLNQTVVGPYMQAPADQDHFPSSRSDSGGFFRHHNGGGYNFGQNNDSGQSGPFSGSRTS